MQGLRNEKTLAFGPAKLVTLNKKVAMYPGLRIGLFMDLRTRLPNNCNFLLEQKSEFGPVKCHV